MKKDISILQVPRPNAIVASGSIQQVKQAIAQFLDAKEFGYPEGAQNFTDMDAKLMQWRHRAGDKAHAVAIGRMGDATVIFDYSFILPGSADFIRDLSQQVKGRVIAGISETHSGCYGLIVYDGGKLVRRFFEDESIQSNEGRLPEEKDTKLESDVEVVWQKLVPAKEVTDIQVQVFAKEPFAPELTQPPATREHLGELIKAGDKFASAKEYGKALDSYREAARTAQGMMGWPPDQVLMLTIMDLIERIRKLEEMTQPKGSSRVVMEACPLSMSETLDVMLEAADKMFRKKNYELALSQYQAVRDLAKGSLVNEPTAKAELAGLIKQVEKKIRECKSKLGK